MGKYFSISEPLTVKQMMILNHTIMTPMGTNFDEQNGGMNFLHINYYEQHAMGGTGLIIVENVCVDYPCSSNGTTQLRIDHDSYIPRLYRLVETIHRHDTKIAVQLNHAGVSAVEERIGIQPVSASGMLNKKNGTVSRVLSKEKILYIIDYHTKAVKCAQIIDFDAVEVHAGHPYSISQFLSPPTDERTDEFGGSYESRTRLARLVLKAARKEVGAQFPIIVCVSTDEFLKSGNTPENVLKLLEYLHAEADIVDVSCGLVNSIQHQIDADYLLDGWCSYMVKAVKEAYAKPVITTGNIHDPRVTEDILEREDIDLISMGCQMIADPGWTNKTYYGKEDTIHKYISRNIGYSEHRTGLNRSIRCSVNLSVDGGERYRSWGVKKPCNVIVIGGDAAGLKATCTVTEVDYTTFLVEKKDHLGGLNVEISKIPDKERLHDFPDYLIHCAEKLRNLTTLTSTEVIPFFMKVLKSDFIINATGSAPLLPPINGLRENIDALEGRVNGVLGMIRRIDQYPKDLNGKKVCTVGGSTVGLDVVEFFAKRGAVVGTMEMLPVVGKGLNTVIKVETCGMLEKHNVQVLTSIALRKVHSDHFVVKRNEQMETLDFDYDSVCLGMHVYSPVMEGLKQTFADEDIELFNTGDDIRARRIVDGVAEGRNVLNALKQKEPLQKKNGTRYIRRNQLRRKGLADTQN